MMQLLKIQLIALLFLAVTACGDLEPKAKGIGGSNNGSANVEQSTESDQEVVAEDDEVSGGAYQGPTLSASTLTFTDTLFSDYKWYSYDLLGGHRVHPIFDVYAIRSSSGEFYKVQIIDYYSKVNTQEAGYYELRLQRPDGTVKKLELAAVGCGDPLGGVIPDCDEKNLYTFLNLDTEEIVRMTAEQAILVPDWDLGFQRTTVLMNTPSVGVGSTQGALLYRNENFFGAFGFAKYDLLMQAYVGGGEEQAFNAVGRLIP